MSQNGIPTRNCCSQHTSSLHQCLICFRVCCKPFSFSLPSSPLSFSLTLYICIYNYTHIYVHIHLFVSLGAAQMARWVAWLSWDAAPPGASAPRAREKPAFALPGWERRSMWQRRLKWELPTKNRICIYTYVLHTYMYVCIFLCVYTCAHRNTCICIYVYVHIDVYTYVDMYKHISIYANFVSVC